MIDFQSVRDRNPIKEYLEARGVVLRRNSREGNFKALCPLHKEKTPSFYVSADGYFYCFGCGARGDVVDLEAALTGKTVVEAAVSLGAANIGAQIAKPKSVTNPQPYTLTDEEQRRMEAGARRLADDEELIAKFVARRPSWTPEAVHAVAMEGNLGYERDCRWRSKEVTFRGPAVLFSYPHGIKVRWPNSPDGKKNTRWITGAPHGVCWRQNLLTKAHKKIVIVEGETDTLTAISDGVELAGDTLVIGLAGAHSYPLPGPFTGR